MGSISGWKHEAAQALLVAKREKATREEARREEKRAKVGSLLLSKVKKVLDIDVPLAEVEVDELDFELVCQVKIDDIIFALKRNYNTSHSADNLVFVIASYCPNGHLASAETIENLADVGFALEQLDSNLECKACKSGR